MAIQVVSAYSGEVLEKLLVRATTGNELVARGLIRVEPNVATKFYIPRLKAGKMLQKRKEQPEDKDSKGDFTYDERALEPQEFMAFTTFNPRSFERIWKKWQPTGELVFRDLPTDVQNALLGELAKVVNFELGDHFVNGVHSDREGDFFNGVLTRILADREVVQVAAVYGPMKAKLQAIYRRIPKALRSSPNLRFIMSVEDWDRYDDELTAQTHKGADATATNAKKFKGIPIEDLAAMPEGVIFATICSMDLDTNLWAGVSMVNDFEAVKIDRLTNAGEKYFFKMLMKVDTNIAFGEEVVLYDERGVFSAEKTELSFPASGGSETVAVLAPGDDFTVSGNVSGFRTLKAGNTVMVTASANTEAEERIGVFSLGLQSDPARVIEITVMQEAGAAEAPGA